MLLKLFHSYYLYAIPVYIIPSPYTIAFPETINCPASLVSIIMHFFIITEIDAFLLSIVT